MLRKVLVFGHSFVHRLDTFLNRQGIVNLRLDSTKFEVLLRGFGGLTLARARAEYFSLIEQDQPTIIILVLGDNDVDKARNQNKDIRLIAADLVQFAQDLLELDTTKIVYIVPAYHRLNPRMGTYEQALPVYNNTIRSICRPLYHTVHWPHRNLSDNWRQYLVYDGIHFNDKGNIKFFRCIRSAILDAASALDSTTKYKGLTA